MILMLPIPNLRMPKMTTTTTLQPSLHGENGGAEAVARLEVALVPEEAKESKEVLVDRWSPVQSSSYFIPKPPMLLSTETTIKPQT